MDGGLRNILIYINQLVKAIDNSRPARVGMVNGHCLGMYD